MFSQSPTDVVWMTLALNGLDQSKTSWSGCSNYVSSCFNPQAAISYRVDQSFVDKPDDRGEELSLYENHKYMLSAAAPFHSVSPTDVNSMGYIEKCNPGDLPERWADDEEKPNEAEHRHPGDRPEDDDPSHSNYNEEYQVIVTKATVHGFGFACPKDKDNESSSQEGEMKHSTESTSTPKYCHEMYAAYQMQFLVRIDPHRKRLIYDCFEAAPHYVDVDKVALPTLREVELYEGITDMESGSRSGGWSDDDEEDEDPLMDQPVSFREGAKITRDTISATHLRSETAKFLTARQFRIALSLDNIVGIRLHYPVKKKPAVLVLELGSPLSQSSDNEGAFFAVRRVMSAQQVDNRFKSIPDWTPSKCASQATRQYMYGEFEELKELAAYLCTISTRIANMFQPAAAAADNATTNSLFDIPSTNLQYNMAPPFVADSLENLLLCGGAGIVARDSLQALAARALISVGAGAENEALNHLSEPVKAVVVGEELRLKSEALQRLKAQTFTVEQVNAQLEAVGFTNEHTGASWCSSSGGCVKQAMALGKVKLPQTEEELHETFWTGECEECGDEVVVTLLDVLNQADYGGNDYPDNTNGAIHCESCEYMGHKYLTGICYNKPTASSGKFHNHCTQCPVFGECIGDYRTSHCDVCGEHWFQGNSGFPCTGCGSHDGSKRKGKSPVDEPNPNVWPGFVGLDDLFDSTMNTIQQQLIEAMSARGGTSDDGGMDSMILQMMMMMTGGGGGGGGGIPSDDDEVVINDEDDLLDLQEVVNEDEN